MPKQSAGLLVFRTTNGIPEIFLVHPGGPFYAKKDIGVWSIPKGEFESEDAFAAARREFKEETGSDIAGDFFALTPIKQKGGKWVYAWAVEADIDAENINSNTFTLEFPPKSGNRKEYPEIDRAGWFSVDAALGKILPSQRELIVELIKKI